MEWAIFGATFVFGLIVLGILADHVRQKRKIRQQEMLQRERLAAMEKGLPIPDWDPALLDEEGAVSASPEVMQRRREWFRFITLWTGLVLVFGGIGMFAGFRLSWEEDFRDIASLGALPFFTGLGLLLFYFLTHQWGSR